jgi:hypothetical protein
MKEGNRTHGQTRFFSSPSSLEIYIEQQRSLVNKAYYSVSICEKGQKAKRNYVT